MIRPFTVVCTLMAGGAGLYLYQTKHQAQMLDREIGKVIKQTENSRERIGMLRAEWALLNEPERLAELARAHLGLRTLAPTQFVALADLVARLPPPAAPAAPAAPESEPEEAPAPAVAQAAPPPPRPAPARPVAVAEARPAESRSAETRLAETRAAETRAAEARNAEARNAEARAAEPRPAPSRHVRPAPVQVASSPSPAPLLPSRPPVLPISVSSAATAPGTIGAAVLRAMRANGPSQSGETAAAYAPPAYATPAYTTPAYARPAYAAPAYAAPAYAPASSLLGGSRGALPPPVPFAAR